MRLIHPLILLRILSTILLIQTISFVICLPVSLIYGESLMPFLLSAAVTGLFYLVFRYVTRKTKIADISNRDAYLAVTLSWIFFSVFGTLPYITSGTISSFIDAFFEASSGFTTTGSSILPNVEILPYSIILYRSLTHWIGGLGIIVLVIIILPSLKIAGFQLLSLESSLKEKIHPQTKAIGFRLMFIYLGLTFAETIALVMGEMNLFESICHTFGTVATGGFSIKNTSLTDYSAYSQYIISLFMFFSGISYVVYYYLFKRNFKKVKQNEELWFYLSTTIFFGTLLTCILLIDKPISLEPAFRQGFFQTISFITTTGYTNTDYLLWPHSAVLVLFMLLFTGASTGSSTGNIKMARHLIVIKNIRKVFFKLINPRGVSLIMLNNRVLTDETNISVISFIVLYLFIFLASTVVVIVSGIDPITSASAVAASLGNVGPGLGSVGPLFNYSHLPEFIKLFLGLIMILGRLEIFTIYVLFTRSFWKL